MASCCAKALIDASSTSVATMCASVEELFNLLAVANDSSVNIVLQILFTLSTYYVSSRQVSMHPYKIYTLHTKVV